MDQLIKSIKEILLSIKNKSSIVQILIGSVTGMVTGMTTEKIVKSIIFSIAILTLLIEISNGSKYFGKDNINNENIIYTYLKKGFIISKAIVTDNSPLAIGFIAGYLIGFSY